MYKCFIVALILIVLLLGVKIKTEKRIREQERNRKRVKKVAEVLLDRQIEILSKGTSEVTFELEIAKFIKDGLLLCLEEGTCTPGVVRKAHVWLRKEFPEEFKIFMKDSEEWERRSYMLVGMDADPVQKKEKK